jgi:hypothetical protein
MQHRDQQDADRAGQVQGAAGRARTDLAELNGSLRHNINSALGYCPPIELMPRQGTFAPLRLLLTWVGISAAASQARGGSAVNSWEYWHADIPNGLRQLAALRDQYIAQAL